MGTGNIEEVVLASCTPPLERSAFPPPPPLRAFPPLSFPILRTCSNRDFTGLFSSIIIVIERISQRNRGGGWKRGFDCAEKKASVGSSPVTSQHFDLTGASWSTPLTPSNHFLAARWFPECSYPVFNVLSSRPLSFGHSTSRPRIVEKENTWRRCLPSSFVSLEGERFRDVWPCETRARAETFLYRGEKRRKKEIFNSSARKKKKERKKERKKEGDEPGKFMDPGTIYFQCLIVLAHREGGRGNSVRGGNLG